MAELEMSPLIQTESHARQQPEGQPGQYISDTFSYIKTVKDFCDKETTEETAWTAWTEVEKLKNELGNTLSDTLGGLEELYIFLDAVEKLAVTSPFVLMDEFFQFEGVNAEAAQSVISAARTVSPLLIPFKTKDKKFFLPELDNVDLLVHQLHKYICITKWLCKKMRSSKIQEVTGIQHHTSQPSFSTDHLNQLSRIRMDESFRLKYLFDAHEFVKVYPNTDMSQSLSRLDKNVFCLNSIKDTYSVCTIIGSLIGIVGGSLSIAGLVCTSKTLAWRGGVLGILSTIMNLSTGIDEFRANKNCMSEAKSNIDSFMKDMQKVVDCLEQATSSQRPAPPLEEANIELGAMKAMSHFRTIFKGFDAIMDVTAVLKPLDFSQFSTYITLGGNICALLADLFFFFKELCSLFLRKKSNVSQLICSRTALWRSEMKAWKRIKECLLKEGDTFQKNKDILETYWRSDDRSAFELNSSLI